MSIKTDKAAQKPPEKATTVPRQLPVHLLKKWKSTNPSFSR